MLTDEVLRWNLADSGLEQYSNRSHSNEQYRIENGKNLNDFLEADKTHKRDFKKKNEICVKEKCVNV